MTARVYYSFPWWYGEVCAEWIYGGGKHGSMEALYLFVAAVIYLCQLSKIYQY